MIAQIWSRALRQLVLVTLVMALVACGRKLPFPTPAQHDLVVVTTSGPLTHSTDDSGHTSGLEHDLAEAFAQELGVGVKFIVVPPDEVADTLAAGKAHLAAAWLPSPPADAGLQPTEVITQSRDVILQHEASLPLDAMSDLQGKTVHVLRGSRQIANLQNLRPRIPGLKIVESESDDIYGLLEALENRRIEYIALDATLAEIAGQFAPSLQTSLTLGKDQEIVWWFGSSRNDDLLPLANKFLARAQQDGTLARIEDRYLGHVRRLKSPDVLKFVSRMNTMLPKLRQHFHTAQGVTGIDWRLIAAVAYQESQWEQDATSPTGVRGIMMLTEETADRLGVSNRLDPRESILAGARYINLLKDQYVDEASEPDRTWLALAAYNIGPGHFNSARILARQLGASPTAWYEMKRILPLLAQPKYAQRLKTGRARGGEAVILVENIRSYYDILLRHEAPRSLASAGSGKKAESTSAKTLGALAKAGRAPTRTPPGKLQAKPPRNGPGLKGPGEASGSGLRPG